MRPKRILNPEQYLKTADLGADLRGRSLRGGAVSLVAQGIRFIVQLASAMMLGRLLTPQDFGLVAMVTAVTGFLGLFGDMGLGTATIQRDDVTHAQVSALFWVNTGVGTLFMAATVVIAPILERFYGEPRLFSVAIVTGLAFPLGGLAVQHQALLRRQMRFTALAMIDTASLTVGVTVAITSASLGASYWALVYLSLGMGLTTVLAVWSACGWRPGPPRREKISELLSFGGHLTVVEILMYFGRNVDSILIGRFYGAEPLGQYSRAYSLLMVPFQQIAGPLVAVAIPVLSRLRNEPARFRKALLSLQQVIALTMIPLSTFMIGTADWLVRIALGPQWENAGQLFAILGFAALTEGLGSTGVCIFMTQGRTDRFLQWGILNTVVTVLAIVAGLPWGPRGVAISYAISGLLLRTPLMFWIAGTVSSVRTSDFYSAVAPFMFASMILLGGLTWFRWQIPIETPIWGVVAALGMAVPTYFGALWFIPSGRRAVLDLRDNLALLCGARL
jgi:O-antigen/teichoic acid export membrane protein